MSRRDIALVAMGAGAVGGVGAAYATRKAEGDVQIVVPVRERIDVIDVVDHGADATGKTDSSKQIQAALDAGARNGTLVVASGKFRVDSGIAITSSVDLGEAAFTYTGTATAVTVGGKGIRAIDVVLPRITCAAKTSMGWKSVTGSVGVHIDNLYSSRITVPIVQSFDRGLVVSGSDRNGTAYCTIFVGHLDNNRVNLHLTGAAGGWSNQNTYIGGRWSHNSGEGVGVAGTRHILCDASAPDNNVWLNASLESPGVVEFAIDMDSGRHNLFLSPRFEDTRGSGSVRWGALAQNNIIIGGYGLSSLHQERVTGESGNSTLAPNAAWFGLEGSVAFNLISHDKVLSIRSSDSAPAYPEVASLGTSGVKGRSSHDRFDRVDLNFTTGQVHLGNGSTTPAAGLNGSGGDLRLIAQSVVFSADNVTDVGSTLSRPRYVRAGTAVVTGTSPTTARPSAKQAGIGAMIYDASLSLPLWSDGIVWHDAAGSVR